MRQELRARLTVRQGCTNGTRSTQTYSCIKFDKFACISQATVAGTRDKHKIRHTRW
jgi:hypothetical protein